MANTLILESSAFTTTKHPTFLSSQSTPLLRPYPIRLSSLTPFSSLSINPKLPPKTFKFTPKCEAKKHNSSNYEMSIKDKTFNSIGFVVDAISNPLNALKKPAIAALLLGALIMYDPNSALAASGGRMGGRSFAPRSSASSSRSYSVPRNSPGFLGTVPYFAPSPFGGTGFYVGPAIGVGAGSSLFLIIMGFAAFVLVSGFLSDRSDDGVWSATEKTSVVKLQVGLLGMARSLQSDLNRIADSADTSTPEGLNYVLTETMLALLRHPDYCISAYSSVDIKRSIEDGEKRFNQLSIEERGKFDEETLVNVNNIKRQSTKTMRATGYSNEYIVGAGWIFEGLFMVGSCEHYTEAGHLWRRSNKIEITILVAAEGVLKLPAINGSMDLNEALQKLGSIPSSKTMAVEVLWTPQNENDTLSERELLEDYPLKPL